MKKLLQPYAATAHRRRNPHKHALHSRQAAWVAFLQFTLAAINAKLVDGAREEWLVLELPGRVRAGRTLRLVCGEAAVCCGALGGLGVQVVQREPAGVGGAGGQVHFMNVKAPLFALGHRLTVGMRAGWLLP